MLSVELMLLSPETGHCSAVKEERGAGDLVLLLDVIPCMGYLIFLGVSFFLSNKNDNNNKPELIFQRIN